MGYVWYHPEMFFKKFYKLSLVFMFTNQQNANIKDSLQLLKESRCMFSVNKSWGMELYFIKKQESRSDLHVSVSEWENKVMNVKW